MNKEEGQPTPSGRRDVVRGRLEEGMMLYQNMESKAEMGWAKKGLP